MRDFLKNSEKRRSFRFKSVLMTMFALVWAMNVQAQSFVPVTDISILSALVIPGTPLTLTGTVAPTNATNQEIVWSIKNAGGTGATITEGNKLNATGYGQITVTATIADGVAQGTDYTKDFEIIALSGSSIVNTTRSVDLCVVQITEEGAVNVVYNYIYTPGMVFSPPVLEALREALDTQETLLNNAIASELSTDFWAGDFELGTVDWHTVDWWDAEAVAANPNLVTGVNAGDITSNQDNPEISSFTVLTSENITTTYIYVDGELYPITTGVRVWDKVTIFEIAVTKVVSETFVPVTDITSVPDNAVAGTPLTLTGTVVPSDATNQTIVWSISASDTGTTGASISGAAFTATAAGTATITATIANGTAVGTDYTQDFTITVNNPIEIIVTANSGQSTYGQRPSNPGLSATRVDNGERVYVLTGLYNNFYITSTTKPGSYLLEVEGTLTNPGYIVTKTMPGIWRVYKITGAKVSALPAVCGTPTSTCITLNSVSIPDNPGNQTVEYAINIAGGYRSANLDALVWQSDTVFTGNFTEGTYYAYARSAANDYYATGAAQVSPAFTVEVITGMKNPVQAKALNAWVENGTLHVGGLTIGKPWSIYNLYGQLIYTGIANSDKAEIPLAGKGIYIIMDEKESIKTVVP